MRERTGIVKQDAKGRWYARTTYTDSTGRRRQLKRIGKNKSDAKELLKDLLRKIDDGGEQNIEGERMSFSEVLDYYQKNYLVPATYVGDRKVSGRRALKNKGIEAHMNAIRSFFGRMRLRDIRYSHIEQFKHARLAAKTVQGNQRTISTVNKDLSFVRRILNIAVREGWITRNPFNTGEPLISLADENRRTRVLSYDEEERLLAACTGRGAHLRPIIIVALDTGLRRGEILKMIWNDIDFNNDLIHIQAFNTKTMRSRTVGISDRMRIELHAIYEAKQPKMEDRVFGLFDNIKKSFATACHNAGIVDFRFHDIRHTAATRLAAAGVPLTTISGCLGHTTTAMTNRYINATASTALELAQVVNRINAARPITTVGVSGERIN